MTNLNGINPREWALFLDLDGTLVDIQTTPGDVFAPPGLTALLGDLVDTFSGAVAIITGRRLSDVDEILSPLRLIGAGVHGIQLRKSRDGEIETLAPQFPRELLQSLQALAKEHPGIVVEPKISAVAMHYRQAPFLRDKLERALRVLVSGYHQQLELCTGRMVFEIMPHAYSKGQALVSLSALEIFRGRHPVMIGDDAPDVSAIDMAHSLGGLGLRVAGEFFPARAAQFKSTLDVRQWLGDIVGNRAAPRLNTA